MKIQVVFREVGEGGSLEMDAPHPVRASAWEETSITTYWHPASAIRANSPCSAKLSGVVRSVGITSWPIMFWMVPMKAHFGPGHLLQHCLQQEGHRGFAIGSGDPHHGHALGRVAVPIGAHACQGPAAEATCTYGTGSGEPVPSPPSKRPGPWLWKYSGCRRLQSRKSPQRHSPGCTWRES